MKAIIIKADTTQPIVETEPKNGKDFQIDEVKAAIGGGYIEVIGTPEGRLMVLDEDGKRKKLPLNLRATAMVAVVLQPSDFIAGDVLVCDRDQIQ